MLHTQPLQITLTAHFEVHVRSPVNLQGVDIIAALQFVLPWLGHRINANIVLVPKGGEGWNEIQQDRKCSASELFGWKVKPEGQAHPH